MEENILEPLIVKLQLMSDVFGREWTKFTRPQWVLFPFMFFVFLNSACLLLSYETFCVVKDFICE